MKEGIQTAEFPALKTSINLCVVAALLQEHIFDTIRIAAKSMVYQSYDSSKIKVP